jgi:hypothetical protein
VVAAPDEDVRAAGGGEGEGAGEHDPFYWASKGPVLPGAGGEQQGDEAREGVAGAAAAAGAGGAGAAAAAAVSTTATSCGGASAALPNPFYWQVKPEAEKKLAPGEVPVALQKKIETLRRQGYAVFTGGEE